MAFLKTVLLIHEGRRGAWWPTLVTLIMFPILVTMYVKLARREEREVLEEFGERYARYAAATPAFVPRRPQPIVGGAA